MKKPKGLTPDIEPPTAKRIRQELVAHRHTRIDPYFWLRDDVREDKQVIEYLEAENAYTEAALAPVADLAETLFEELKSRIAPADASVPIKRDDFLYYHRYEADREHPIYCRAPVSAPDDEAVILDVNALAEGHDYYSVGALSVSDDGRWLAFTEDTVSRRQYTLRVKDLTTGEIGIDKLENTTGTLCWAGDNKTLFVVKRHHTTLRGYRVWRHTRGTLRTDDAMVFEEADDTFWLSVKRSRSKRYILISSHSTITDEVRVIDAADPTSESRPLTERLRGHEYSAWHHQSTFYIRTNWDAPNFRLMACDDDATDRSQWREVLTHKKDVLLRTIAAFDTHLVVEERKNGLRQLRIATWDDPEGGRPVPAMEPVYTAWIGANPEPHATRLRFGFSSPITPTTTFEVDLVDPVELTQLKQEKVGGGFDPAAYRTERRWAEARDGRMIPISITLPAGFEVDGTGAVYQYAYGSYGHSLDPEFRRDRLSLLDRGIAVAVCHIRGGQELGRQWYEDGKLHRKMNTFTDFIDATQFLMEEGYAHPAKVIAEGKSAGGMLMGVIANVTPGLYHAIHAGVPFVDCVTTMLDETIPLTTFEYDEWGNPNESAFYDTMMNYSPYDNVAAQDYPHMLVTTGLHDSQVQYWEPAKWVAKLRHAKTNDNLLLLLTDMSTGHGGQSGRYERYRQTAREYAFLLYTLGITA